MPSINMIAPRRAEKLRKERDMRRLVFVIMAELVFAVGLGGWAATNLFSTKGQISDLDVQISKLQPVVDQIKKYDASTKKLQPKLKLLNDSKSITMRWYNTLDQLTQSMPASTYLASIGIDASGSSDKNDDSKKTMRIVGIAGTQAQVGEAMMRIQGIPDLSNVDLHYAKNTVLTEYDIPIGFNGHQIRMPRSSQAVEFEIGSELKLSDSKGAKDGVGQS